MLTFTKQCKPEVDGDLSLHVPQPSMSRSRDYEVMASLPSHVPS